ncbi:NrfD/PsrC family molybdoenzyme membrane anchor subunit [Paracraurococcus lichenis]|uniref:NrfD/PsrC family molybdoenzyme membrane anchor subunit n=1 Tax=Paracraurococcus lichenis TaxID=3064888 RepID=A0ABT9DY05_9PROT|nr:NrfD/PsrC family molybdoenzyme membrane anchor subunit [Paracraurococcus sp. LOR1-02]MDO9708778.1 NrfD/PsrC family molybdoenzyme membrane anchor subunit [Paracraurococcus sp. LOR1-02]
MSEVRASLLGPEDPAPKPPSATGGTQGLRREWRGPTYYGRPALKAAPFNNWVVGGYIFLAGLSGAAAILSTLADRARPRHGRDVVRRGRYLSLLAPTVGASLLVYDLHTPQRFYNMLRVAKGTSPMSIGTWLLMGFSAAGGLAAAMQFLADRMPWRRWPGRVARAASVPAAALGAGMSTYTAALLAATSTPLWAAAPRALAMRFGGSSIASGAAALSLGEPPGPTRRALDAVAVAALAAELAAASSQRRSYDRAGVAGALEGGWGQVERIGATGLGTALPLGLHALSLAEGGDGRLSRLASLAILGGSLLLRVSTMAAGDVSANRPEVSFRFAQPDNLPGPGRRTRSVRASRRAALRGMPAAR